MPVVIRLAAGRSRICRCPDPATHFRRSSSPLHLLLCCLAWRKPDWVLPVSTSSRVSRLPQATRRMPLRFAGVMGALVIPASVEMAMAARSAGLLATVLPRRPGGSRMTPRRCWRPANTAMTEGTP